MESETYRTLVSATIPDSMQLNLCVWDNSKDAAVQIYQEKKILNNIFNNFIYHHSPENTSLSQVYNYVAQNLLANNDYLIIFDDDSTVPVNYLSELDFAVTSSPLDCHLFIPRVINSRSLVSPAFFLFGWGHYWKSIDAGVYKSKFTTIINSGIVISRDYIKSHTPLYDETLKFYGTDTSFMFNYCKQGYSYCVLNSDMYHDLSFFSSSNSQRLNKFISMRSGVFSIYRHESLWVRFLVFIVMFLVSIRYAVVNLESTYVMSFFDE